MGFIAGRLIRKEKRMNIDFKFVTFGLIIGIVSIAVYSAARYSPIPAFIFTGLFIAAVLLYRLVFK